MKVIDPKTDPSLVPTMMAMVARGEAFGPVRRVWNSACSGSKYPVRQLNGGNGNVEANV